MLFISIVWGAIFVMLMWKMSPPMSDLSKKSSDSLYSVFGNIADTITNIFSLFNFAKSKNELQRIENQLDKDYIPSYKSTGMYNVYYNIVFDTLGIIFFAFNLIFIVYLHSIGQATTGDIVFTFAVTDRFIDCISRFTGSLQGVISYVGSLKSSLSILDVPISDIDKLQALPIKITKGKIIFKDINFYYEPSKNIFVNFNLTIKSGQKIGIIGTSGAGKTTFIAILLKNFKINSGNITIDDQNIYDYTSESLRNQISIIPQEIMLFNRSLAENIGYGKENSSLIEIIKAAKKANIHNFIDSLPEKYNTFVGERGIKLSGGQRQRIAIARAILKNAQIIILDEATSSLDTETEREVQISIDAIIKESKATVIAIAHRTSTLKYMDKIIEIGNGKIIREGSFDEICGKNS